MNNKKPFISLTTDFEKQSRGIAAMKGTILKVCPNAKIMDLVHGIPGFDLIQGARALEGIPFLPIGFHVAVIDPGVGTKRKAVALEVKRGDILIGPDNGVLIPATRFLGGIKRVFEIKNEDFFQKPVSPVFHGRDVFASTASHLARGKKLEELGPEMNAKQLVKAPYSEAKEKNGRIECTVIHVNRFGNVFLNLMQREMQKAFRKGETIEAESKGKRIEVPYVKTFGDVKESMPVILDDDFGRVEMALNQRSFAERYGIDVGTKIVLSRKP